MKKSVALQLLILFAAVAFLWVEAYGATGNCPAGMTAYWPLDEQSAGSYVEMVSDLGAACVNCPDPTTDGAVRDKGAQSFNGLNDMLTVAANDAFDWSSSDRFSIELWMKRAPITEREVLIARKDASTSMEWRVEVVASGQFRFALFDQNGNGGVLTGSKTVDNSVWHHVAVVRDGSQMKLYVDGELEDSSSPSFDSGFASSAQITIGGVDATDPKYFGGLIDEVAIYGTDLDLTTIQSHYYLSRQYCSLFNSSVRIMPMGDSITDDNQTPGTSGNGYRKPLWDDLNDNLFWVDFIGSRHSQTSDFDNDHAGFPGITDNRLAVLLDTGTDPGFYGTVTAPDPYLDVYPADVVLLHIGTNALEDNAADVAAVLNAIFASDFRTTVILAKIINQVPEIPLVTDFNTSVATMAANRIAEGDKIIMVDMEDGAGLDYIIGSNHDFVNQLHPNDNGYPLMADQWYVKLNDFLPQVTALPTITSSPIATANKGQAYTYDVEATGTPAPTYQLATAPTGMTIDEQSGLIQWTPDAVGLEHITVEAASVGADWGKDTQAFTILVNGVPETVADSFSVVEGATLSESASGGVLINDTDEDGDSLTAILVTGPSAGTLTLNDDGSFIYIHDGSETSTDHFTYKASDGKAESQATTVTISISPVNDPPVISTQPTVDATVNQLYTYAPEATDAEGDDVSWSLVVQPNGMSINNDTGEIAWTPQTIGSYGIELKATDANAGETTQRFTVTVTKESDNPGGGSGSGSGGGGCFIQSIF